jgi:hypothetical protein
MSQVPSDAIQVINDFLDASQRKDMKAMEACLTRQSLESGQFNGSGPEGVRMAVGETHMEGELAVVTVGTFPLDAPPDNPPVMQMPCILIQENGQWKFDLAATMERMMSGVLNSAVAQVADGMSQAMDKLGHALGDALGGSATAAAGETDPSWQQASLTPEADEIFPLPEMRRLPQTTLRVTPALGFDVPVDMNLGQLVAHLAGDELDNMVNQMADWFDGSFFGEWEKIFQAVAASGVPVRNRLRTVRIEGIDRFENRIILLDGSDLVYRLNPTNAEGYFSDDLITTLLPGVLAGLPAKIDSTIAGKRTLPLDSDRPTSEFYRQRWVPRWMRRISDLLDKPVALDVDWQSAADATNVGPQLPQWGLNRVYGALALACLDTARKDTLKRELSAIEIAVGSSVYKKFAKYESGKLSVGLCYYGGDTPGCYEHEIAAALAGQAFEG